MVYRIAIITGGLYYYLMSDPVAPELDTAIVEDSEFEFDDAAPAAQTFKYSTKELAQQSITSLPYPYNEKSEVVALQSEEDPLPRRRYYRAGKYLPRIWWLNQDNSYTRTVSIETIVQANDLVEIEEHIKTLPGWDEKVTRVIEVLDYGEPNYAFTTRSIGPEKVIEFGDKTLAGSTPAE